MKKMLPWLISLLLAITMIVVVAIIFGKQFLGGSETKDPGKQVEASVAEATAKPMSADEMIEVASELTDIKTNIADTSYVVIMSFAFQLDSKHAKEEFEKIKEIQIKPIINRELWVMTPEDLQGIKGKDALCAKLINEINRVITEGKVTKVEIKDFIMQQV